MPLKLEKTLVLIKPDAMQRSLLGEIISRFERKGLKIIGLKMIQLEDAILDEHYAHHKNQPFFTGLKNFMKSVPVVAMVLEGIEVIAAVRLVVGPTKGRAADAGSIRGDLSMSTQTTLVHASDSPESAEKEVYRFFNDDELFDYKKINFEYVYGEEERDDLVA
jgi:nucleoside-diphosphate kinase